MDAENRTLDENFWKDSFDRLLDTKSPLKKQNIIKKNVRASFNYDSSVENSDEAFNLTGTNKGESENNQNNELPSSDNTKRFSNVRIKVDVCNGNQSTENINRESQVSTPMTNARYTKRPFVCLLSPINDWTFKHFKIPTQEDFCNSKYRNSWIHKYDTTLNVIGSSLGNHQLRVSAALTEQRDTSIISLDHRSKDDSLTRTNYGVVETHTPLFVTKRKSALVSHTPAKQFVTKRKSAFVSHTPAKQLSDLPIVINKEISNNRTIRDEEYDNFNDNINQDKRIDNIAITLLPGKWRRSLTVWKKKKKLADENEMCEIFPAIDDDKENTPTIRGQYSVSSKYNRKTSILLKRYSSQRNSIFRHSVPRTQVLKCCNQNKPISFCDTFPENDSHSWKKIGEGAYGEVFSCKQDSTDIVIKVIPIEGNFEINGEQQKSYQLILPEILIAMELSNLRTDRRFATSGFVELKSVHCVQGKYPKHLIDLWEIYKETVGTENDDPNEFPENQHFIIFELENGGKDLESFIFLNSEQSFSAFIQIVFNLAVAEQILEFEHRDLHWGNVLVKSTKETFITFKIDGKEMRLLSKGIKVTIIDYTLSRVMVRDRCLFNDLSTDVDLFSATGDYQYEIYRLMKYTLENDWERYNPYTNVLWMHYTIGKIISGVHFRKPRGKVHSKFVRIFNEYYNNILNFKSAYDFLKQFVFDNIDDFLISNGNFETS